MKIILAVTATCLFGLGVYAMTPNKSTPLAQPAASNTSISPTDLTRELRGTLPTIEANAI